jgi:hypothetical protein
MVDGPSKEGPGMTKRAPGLIGRSRLDYMDQCLYVAWLDVGNWPLAPRLDQITSDLTRRDLAAALSFKMFADIPFSDTRKRMGLL